MSLVELITGSLEACIWWARDQSICEFFPNLHNGILQHLFDKSHDIRTYILISLESIRKWSPVGSTCECIVLAWRSRNWADGQWAWHLPGQGLWHIPLCKHRLEPTIRHKVRLWSAPGCGAMSHLAHAGIGERISQQFILRVAPVKVSSQKQQVVECVCIFSSSEELVVAEVHWVVQLQFNKPYGCQITLTSKCPELDSCFHDSSEFHYSSDHQIK